MWISGIDSSRLFLRRLSEIVGFVGRGQSLIDILIGMEWVAVKKNGKIVWFLEIYI